MIIIEPTAACQAVQELWNGVMYNRPTVQRTTGQRCNVQQTNGVIYNRPTV